MEKSIQSLLAARPSFKSGRVGVFAVGHYVYWPQFPGVKEKLLEHTTYLVKELQRDAKATIIAAEGICDSSQRAFEIGDFFARQQLDLLFCFVATYAPSGHVLPVIQRAGVPVVLLGLQPSAAMDYARATIALQLENDNVTSLPEIAGAMARANQWPIDVVVGTLRDDARAWKRIYAWCEVATVRHEIRNARIGLLGHVYEGMLDMNSDPTMADSHFQMHVEHMEMEDLKKCIDGVSEQEVQGKIALIEQVFEFADPGADPIAVKAQHEDILWPARVACGMDRLVADFGLTGLAYYYRGLDGNEFERVHAAMIIGNSFLTSLGVPIAGELDLKNCIAMLIMDRFGAGGSFAEFHPVDFAEDFVLVGHDGPHHLLIADGKPILRKLKLYHGKRGSGPSVEYKLKVGPITMLGLTQTHEGKFKMVVAEGESLPGMIPATGNTNTRGRFEPDIRTFLERWTMAGPTHHFALGIGHLADRIELLARSLGIEYVLVTPRVL